MKYETGIETKRIILEVALKEFLTTGYHETSIRKIAKEAFISSGALYNHFNNKEDILHHIIDPHIENFWEICNHNLSKFKENIIDKNTNSFSSEDHTYIELFEKNIDVWKFILFKSKNTKYETFRDELLEWEYINTRKMLDMVYEHSEYLNYISEQELKYITNSYIDSYTNTFKLDIDKYERVRLIKIITQIYQPFWELLFSKKILKKEDVWTKKHHQMKK